MRSKPCKCKHYQNVHLIATKANRAICLRCDTEKEFFVHEFKLDNLRWLEDEALEKRI